MRGTNRFALALLVVGIVVPGLSCNGTSLDSGDAADVVLEVQTIPQIPPIQATFDAASGTCLYTVAPINVTLENRPLSASAANSRPFNDIVAQTVTLTYTWVPESGIVTPPRTMDIGGTVPVGGTVAVSFPPITLDDLLAYNLSGHTATNVTMIFRGRTVDGNNMVAEGRGGAMSINSCVVPPGP